MNKSDFLEFCSKKEYSRKDLDEFEKAIEFSQQELKQNTKLCGESLLENNLSIAKILSEGKIQKEVIIAGILYGLETEVLPSKIIEKFGEEISDLVYGNIQFRTIKSKNVKTESETLRKILLASLKDIRIIFIKIASKLHNIKTIEVLPIQEQKRIAEEILEIYAPLASRLGLEYLKRELEDEAFKIINPKKYKEIQNFLKASKEEREKFLLELIQKISENIKENQIYFIGIKGRNKHLYSIYKKIIERKIPLNSQRDHFAIRIIVNSKEDCYRVLGVLHREYESLEGKLKDYISNPKSNGYQSLHTSLKIEKKLIEIQIRTKEMDEFAEEGKAAHWNYKHLKSDEEFEKKTAWLRSLLEDPETQKNKELLKTIKLSLFGNRFYCYTPKGKAIDLPVGATALDFAYHIHQEIGNKAVGARVNGHYVSLKHKIKSDDIVEIITNKNQRPRRDWMKFVVSQKAKSVLRREIKRIEELPVSSATSLKKQEKTDFDSLVYSEEFPNHKYIFAKCCNPIPNKKIIGIIKSFRKILVHEEKCKNIQKTQDKIIPLFWKETFNRPIQLFVDSEDRQGILADILNTISNTGFVVKSASIKQTGNNFVECNFIIVPQKLENIVNLIKRIEKVMSVKKIKVG